MTTPQDDSTSQLVGRDAVRLGMHATSQEDAIRQCGRVLAEVGAVDEQFTDAMLDREQSVSTFLGQGVAIPHGTDDARGSVRRAALAVLRFDEPIDWDGHEVSVCVPIAAAGEEHVEVLQSLAVVLRDDDKARRLKDSNDVEEIIGLLSPQTGE